MSKPKKVLEEAPVPTVVTFDGQKFEIKPMSARSDDFAYDDAAEFLILVVPVASRIFSELMSAGQSGHGELFDSYSNLGSLDDAAVASLALDTITMIAEMNIASLLKDVAEVFPRLAALACHATDPDVREKDIKRWAKTPLELEMWRAVVLQIKADNIMGQIAQLKGLLGEFSQSAAA